MRDLARLNSKELRLLATSPDPSRNVNLKSAGSHLSKILIPRPRMCLSITSPTPLKEEICSGHCKQHLRS